MLFPNVPPTFNVAVPDQAAVSVSNFISNAISIPSGQIIDYPISLSYTTQIGGKMREVENLLSAIGHKTEGFVYYTVVVVNDERSPDINNFAYHTISMVSNQFGDIRVTDSGELIYVFKVAPLIDVTRSPDSSGYTGIKYLKSLKQKHKTVSDLAQAMGGWSISEYYAAVAALILSLNALAVLDKTQILPLESTPPPSYPSVITEVRSQQLGGVQNQKTVLYRFVHIGGQGITFDMFSQGTGGPAEPQVAKITSAFRSVCTNIAYQNSLNNEVAQNSLHLYFRAVDLGGIMDDDTLLVFKQAYLPRLQIFFANSSNFTWFTQTLYSQVYKAMTGKFPNFSMEMVFHGSKQVGGNLYPNHLHVGFVLGGNILASKFKWRPGV